MKNFRDDLHEWLHFSKMGRKNDLKARLQVKIIGKIMYRSYNNQAQTKKQIELSGTIGSIFAFRGKGLIYLVVLFGVWQGTLLETFRMKPSGFRNGGMHVFVLFTVEDAAIH
jgi:hypothetical protein